MIYNTKMPQVKSFNGRTLAVAPQRDDYTTEMVGLDTMLCIERQQSIVQILIKRIGDNILSPNIVYFRNKFLISVYGSTDDNGYYQNNSILVSEDLITWSEIYLPNEFPSSSPKLVVLNNKLFGFYGNMTIGFCTSDLINFTKILLPANAGNRISAAYGNGTYVVVFSDSHYSSTHIFTSQDGVEWNLKEGINTPLFDDITYAFNNFFLLNSFFSSDEGYNQYAVSKDNCETWEIKNFGRKDFSPAKFLFNGTTLIAPYSSYIAVCKDGEEFTIYPSNFDSSTAYTISSQMAVINECFYLFDSRTQSNSLFASQDGINWEKKTSNLYMYNSSITKIGEDILLYSSQWQQESENSDFYSSVILYSRNGVNWYDIGKPIIKLYDGTDVTNKVAEILGVQV